MKNKLADWIKSYTNVTNPCVDLLPGNIYQCLNDISISNNAVFPKDCKMYLDYVEILHGFEEDTLTIPENICVRTIVVNNSSIKCININTQFDDFDVYKNKRNRNIDTVLDKSLDSKLDLFLFDCNSVETFKVNFRENKNINSLNTVIENIDFYCNTAVFNLKIHTAVKNIKGFNVKSKDINEIYIIDYSGYDLSAFSQYNIQSIILSVPKNDTLHNICLKALKYVYTDFSNGFLKTSFNNPATIIDFFLSGYDSTTIDHLLKTQSTFLLPPTIHEVVEKIISSNQIELFKKFDTQQKNYIPNVYRKTLEID